MRHGHYDTNGWLKPSYATYDYPLASDAEGAVHGAAASIASFGDNISLIYASPFLRTRQTAEILANDLNLDVQIVENLHETSEEEHTHHDYKREYFRVNKFMKENLVSDMGAFIVVSHRDPLSVFICVESGLSLSDIEKSPSNLRILPMSGVYRLVYENDQLVDCKLIFTPKDPID